MIAAIAAATLALSGWTAAVASTVDDVVGEAEHVEVVPPSIRQVEHAVAAHSQWLQQLEHAELNRFRNRAPAWALPALDAEIARLRGELGR